MRSKILGADKAKQSKKKKKQRKSEEEETRDSLLNNQ
jgi:hypothetical protein